MQRRGGLLLAPLLILAAARLGRKDLVYHSTDFIHDAREWAELVHDDCAKRNGNWVACEHIIWDMYFPQYRMVDCKGMDLSADNNYMIFIYCCNILPSGTFGEPDISRSKIVDVITQDNYLAKINSIPDDAANKLEEPHYFNPMRGAAACRGWVEISEITGLELLG